ncbi:MAG: acyl-phosphate glycerol 3-phosphate acyltransferase [Phycisphaerae bacterium]|nr:acyl-phosphate glycerol 3-phosphate acyltransferase [Phycisphaerae bacterium]
MGWTWFFCILGAYLIGSIPFGVLIGRARGINIREHGSRNIGATNVGRVLGRRWGLLCFVLDMGKGAIPVVVAGLLTDTIGQNPMFVPTASLWLWLAVAIAAFCGHMYSMFLNFSGGKGVATAFGVLLAMYPVLTIPALTGLVVWIAALLATRIVSASSMIAAMSIPVATLIVLRWFGTRTEADVSTGDVLARGSAPLTITIAIALLILWRHRTNIGRLLRGEEPRIKSRASTTSEG